MLTNYVDLDQSERRSHQDFIKSVLWGSYINVPCQVTLCLQVIFGHEGPSQPTHARGGRIHKGLHSRYGYKENHCKGTDQAAQAELGTFCSHKPGDALCMM